MIHFDRVLVIAAHPDDEVLGCGGTLARLAADGVELHVALLADGVGSRYGTEQRPDAGVMRQEREQRREAARRAADILGIRTVTFDEFPDNQMDTVPLLTIAQCIERIAGRLKPDAIFTHHAGDVNIDHRRIHEAIAAACRPQPGSGVQAIFCFEIPSSTEWQLPGSGQPFVPNCYYELSQRDCDAKRRALDCYSDEMRSWPHPRSLEAIEALVRLRGAQVGVHAAEAFELVRSLHPLQPA